MDLPLLAEELEIIQAACTVANLRRITSGFQVTKPFYSVIRRKVLILGRPGSKIEPYRELQERLRSWLERITGSNRTPRQRAQVASEVAQFLQDNVHARFVLKAGELRYDYWFSRVEGGCALAVALLLGRGPSVTNRLQQCGWSKCLRFNFDANPTRRPRRFCNERHARLFDNEESAERQRRYRRKLRKLNAIHR